MHQYFKQSGNHSRCGPHPENQYDAGGYPARDRQLPRFRVTHGRDGDQRHPKAIANTLVLHVVKYQCARRDERDQHTERED